MRFWVGLFLFLTASATIAIAESRAAAGLEGSVVRIVNFSQRGDWASPWDVGPVRESAGSGFVIDGGLVMTNAHVVSDSRQLLIYLHNDPKPHIAEVVHVGHDCDLALIRPLDPAPLGAIRSLGFGGLPRLGSTVVTLGYPAGGLQVSSTRGVVSRIEEQVYVHSGKDVHATVQTDAAINGGNSGGPVVQDGQVVGVAFQANLNLESVGFFIPAEVIQRFLQDVEDGSYEGYPELGIDDAGLENPAPRARAGMKEDETGVRIHRVWNDSSAHDRVHVGDILLAVNGQTVANDGSVADGKMRMPYGMLIDRMQIGDRTALDILRDGKRIKVQVPLRGLPAMDRSGHTYDRGPRYFIYGGLVFVALDRETLKTFGDWRYEAPKELIEEFAIRPLVDPERVGQERVVLLRRLRHPVNADTAWHRNQVVDRVNGRVIDSIDSLVEALEHYEGDRHLIEFATARRFGVLDRRKAEAANSEILETLRHSAGPQPMKYWNPVRVTATMAATLCMVIVGLVAAHSPAVAQAALESREVYERSVVGLSVTFQTWNADRPWSKKKPGHRDAAAVLVGDGQLLTTAQIVADATFMQISTFGRAQASEVRVAYIDRDINLALLTVDDPSVLSGLQPVTLAEQTPTSGVVRSVRWRGQQLESAASRITRFVVERSVYSRVEHAFLHLRTDLTGGGWAEPVFDDDELVGLVVSQSGENSRAIPVSVLRAFTEGIAKPGPYRSLPSLGILWQVNRDPAVATFLGQDGDPSGILVRQVPWGSSACGVLKARDILLELDDEPIDTEGYFSHPDLGQLKFNHLLSEHHRNGDVVPVKVLRDGKVLDLKMTLRGYPEALDLIPSSSPGAPPYMVAGGLLLRELDFPYLATWGKDWSKAAPIPLLTRYYFGQEAQTPEHRRTVVLTGVLPSPYNIGYQNLRDEIVERINGHVVGGILDVVEALKTPLNGFHVLELSRDSSRGEIVLDAGAFDAATAEIIETYRVPAAVRLPEFAAPPGGGDCAGEF